MLAIDTSLIVRFLTGDDPAHAANTRRVIEAGGVFVPRTVLLEAEWVLRAGYTVPPARVLSALRGFVGLPGVVVEDAALVRSADEVVW